ncbi:MAG: NADH-quinone oxidoreductase subunit J [Akkermansia sp.]
MDILTSDILFYIFAALAVITSILVVIKRNPVSAAMCMALSFGFSAAILFLLGAHFLGVIQILVYTGAIMVLFLFIIMLLKVKSEESAFRRPLPIIIGLIVIAVFMMQLGGVIYSIPGADKSHRCPMNNLDNALDELCVNDKESAIKYGKNEITLTCASPKVQVKTILINRENTNGSPVIAEEILKQINQQITNGSPIIAEEFLKQIGFKESKSSTGTSQTWTLTMPNQPNNGGINIKTITLSNFSSLIPNEIPCRTRSIGSSPQINLPAINPQLSAQDYPKGSAIRTAIDKGEFPDTSLLGQRLFSHFNVSFVIVGLALLVSTIGVVVLCRRYTK